MAQIDKVYGLIVHCGFASGWTPFHLTEQKEQIQLKLIKIKENCSIIDEGLELTRAVSVADNSNIPQFYY